MGNKNRDQGRDRELGRLWESKFGEIIVEFGFSMHKTPPPGVDGMIWEETGQAIHVQMRHKAPFLWADVGLCWGYEKYRVVNDLKIVRQGGIALYVIHDHSRLGRMSEINELNDWVAQDIGCLAACVDLERVGPTYYGDSYVRKSIYYWTIDKFQPLSEILTKLRDQLT